MHKQLKGFSFRGRTFAAATGELSKMLGPRSEDIFECSFSNERFKETNGQVNRFPVRNGFEYVEDHCASALGCRASN